MLTVSNGTTDCIWAGFLIGFAEATAIGVIRLDILNLNILSKSSGDASFLRLSSAEYMRHQFFWSPIAPRNLLIGDVGFDALCACLPLRFFVDVCLFALIFIRFLFGNTSGLDAP